MDNSKSLLDIIEGLSLDIPFKNTILICSKDGNPIAPHSHGTVVDLGRVAAQVATVFGVSRHIGQLLHLGAGKELSFSGQDGRVFVFGIVQGHCMAVITPSECNVALLNIMANRAIELINQRSVL